METLNELLDAHNWRMLRAITRAHSANFDNRWTKVQAVQQVAELLTDPTTVHRALSNLPDQAHQALQTLLACDGQMPAHRFLDRFGPIRPFRPWRDDSPRAPWRHPTSPTERLWFLGFVFVHSTDRGKVIVVPDELRPLLPTPAPTPAEPMGPLLATPDPILDLAHLLAFLQGRDVTPFAGRWLTPRYLRVLNAMLAYPDPAVAEAHSELQTGYICFLHYLAEAAGLVDVVGGLLKPTPAAWQWLDAPEPQRWRTLWQGWQTDLERPPREASLWDRYRLPGERAFVDTLFETLATVEAWTAPATLAEHLRRRCIGAGTLPPDDDLLTPLQALLSEPLTWAGLVHTDSEGSVALTSEGAWLLARPVEPPEPPPTGHAAIGTCDDEGVLIALPDPPTRPPLRPLVELGLPPESRPTRRLTHERFVDMLACGLGRAWTGERLRKLVGRSLRPATLERLKQWEEQARGLTLRRLTVLTVADSDILDQLAGQRTVRRHFRETLSPHHVAVDPNEIGRLLRALPCPRILLVCPIPWVVLRPVPQNSA